MVYSTVSFVSTPPNPPWNSSMLSSLFKADVVEEACEDMDRRAAFAAVEEATTLVRRADDRKTDEIMVPSRCDLRHRISVWLKVPVDFYWIQYS
mmetsp:Transcript_782/g.1230  ORF Transcript_782/g.1230 Transcript_782/m.1230 type:complete len:94 (-) Transcript_782:31-312(-)